MLFVLLHSSLQLSQTFNCGGGSGRCCRGGSSPCCCELGSWEWGQVLIFSPGTAGPTKLSPLPPDAAHLRLLTQQPRPQVSPPSTLHLPLPASHRPALLTLYSSQRLSICICWSIGSTRSISTLASASLITSSLHAWLFKDNWAWEPASLWVTVGWNDNQLDSIQVQSQQG